ncbi:hypothetical protein [Desulfofarcimen acetoxidans]|uniref:hypothetical protein n=1 Tax=Desulfofarcimen acetoxidans TaxID=58138 RepID=UPI00019E667E|nr:hypothetical protein [Desulfofarcimen acetoxidans]
MAEVNPFSHINLILVKDVPRKKPPKRKFENKPVTAQNKKNCAGHANFLRRSVASLRDEWQETTAMRQQEGLPEIPEAVSIFLKIDPLGLPLDEPRKYGNRGYWGA